MTTASATTIPISSRMTWATVIVMVVATFIHVNTVKCLKSVCQCLWPILALQKADGEIDTTSMQVFAAIVVQLKMVSPRARQVKTQAWPHKVFAVSTEAALPMYSFCAECMFV